jgi:uridine kinase
MRNAVAHSLNPLVLRDVKERGRDIEGCIKQWFAFVKPNFHKYVEPQRNMADIIVTKGIENKVAINMVSDQIRKTLGEKSLAHRRQLEKLGQVAEMAPMSENVFVLDQKPQIVAINTLLQNPLMLREDFIFYFDRVVSILIER